MTPEQYARLCELFRVAVELPADERAQYLTSACEGEPTIRKELERLLAADASSVDDVTSPLVPHPDLPGETSASHRLGEHVGPYVLDQRLGGGGMGTVYLASRRDAYRQRVCIKFIRPGLETEEILSRFTLERQVLADLNHPNIARLLDGGTAANGQPYLVMEYVEGRPFDRLPADTTLAERVRLLRVVAEAVHYAHSRRVLHRDLKPDNILVTADGVPKIVDFGLAKLLLGSPDGSAGVTEIERIPPALTRTGFALGTPGYMAPEQVVGTTPQGPSVDVYGLGAVLYQTLTGRPPFHAATPFETLLQIPRDDPVSPSSLNPNTPRDLETICLKCLQKDGRFRYPTAAEVGDELGRYLAGESILARPEGFWARSRRFTRRNRILVASAAAVFVTLVLAIAGVSLAWVRAARAERNLAAELVDAKLRSATLAVRRGDWAKALPLYDEVLAAGAPDPLGMRLEKVRCLLALNRKDEAQQELQRAAREPNQSRHPILFQLLTCELAMGHSRTPPQSLQALRDWVSHGAETPNGADPLDPVDALYAQGLTADRATDALKFFDEALARNPFHRAAQHARLTLLLLLGRKAEAEKMARDLTTFDPNDPLPVACVTWIEVMEGRVGPAQERLDRLKGLLNPTQQEAADQIFQALAAMSQLLNHGDAMADQNEPLTRAVIQVRKLWKKLPAGLDLEPLGLHLLTASYVEGGWSGFLQTIDLYAKEDFAGGLAVLEPAMNRLPDGTFFYWHGMLRMRHADTLAPYEMAPEVVKAEASFTQAVTESSTLIPRLQRDARFYATWTQALLARSVGAPDMLEMRRRAIANMHWFLAEGCLRSVGESTLLAGLAHGRLADDALARSLLDAGEAFDPTDVRIYFERAKVELSAGSPGAALRAAEEAIRLADQALSRTPPPQNAQELQDGRKKALEVRENAFQQIDDLVKLRDTMRAKSSLQGAKLP